MTHAEHIRDLKQRHADELARLTREGEMLELIDADMDGRDEPTRIFVLKRRDSLGAAWLTYGDKHAHGISARRTVPDLVRLLRQFPPVALSMLKDGCTSIRADARITAEQAERAAEYLPLEPVTFDFEGGHMPVLAHWFSRLGADDLMRLEVVLGLPYEQAPRMTGQRVLAPGETYYRYRRSENIPTGWQRIQWATGGPQYLGRGTLWAHYDEGRTLADTLTEWGGGDLRDDESFMQLFDVDALAPAAIVLPEPVAQEDA